MRRCSRRRTIDVHLVQGEQQPHLYQTWMFVNPVTHPQTVLWLVKHVKISELTSNWRDENAFKIIEPLFNITQKIGFRDMPRDMLIRNAHRLHSLTTIKSIPACSLGHLDESVFPNVSSLTLDISCTPSRANQLHVCRSPVHFIRVHRSVSSVSIRCAFNSSRIEIFHLIERLGCIDHVKKVICILGKTNVWQTGRFWETRSKLKSDKRLVLRVNERFGRLGKEIAEIWKHVLLFVVNTCL